MIKNDGARTWVNRIVGFLVGGLIVLLVMSVAVVSPVKSQNSALKTQLDEVQFGASRLLAEAKTLIDSKNYSGAQRTLATLLEKQPGSSEAVEGKKLNAAIDAMSKEMDGKWAAAVDAIRAQWQAKAASDLRGKLEEARLQQERDMTETLNKEWDKAKADVRLAWENPKK